jgi:TRAP transporter 4TM/12TM fusion protein
MVNGSGAANVVTTGTFTIPLMKKTGFDKDTAGAIEAVASNGGQIMPPVMGAVAFLMADATSIPYAQICKAALMPAVLYYLTLSVSVFSYSHKHQVPVAELVPGKTPGRTFKKGWYYFLPLLMLVYLMITGISAQRAALYSILLSLLIGLISDCKRFTLKNLINVCTSTADGMIAVAVACMLAGIITGVINITGFGLKISGLITTISGSNILLLSVLTAIICLIMGMGLPTSACYIVLAILVAPAMVSLNIPVISAHMFILYFGTIASLTPPVALAVFAASGISGGGMWGTGLKAMKLGAAGFLVPFIFIFDNTLLLIGQPFEVFIAVTTAIAGCTIMALALTRWIFRDLHLLESILMIPCSIFLIMPRPLWLNGVGAVGAAIVLFIAWRDSKRNIIKLKTFDDTLTL